MIQFIIYISTLIVLVTAKTECPTNCFCNKQRTSVNCEGKLFHQLPPNMPIQVEKLYLSHNKITEIKPFTFAPFKVLSYLDLGQNLITKLDKDSFSNCSSLQKLYFVTNIIEDIHPDAFMNTPQILYLNLAANRLKSVPRLPHLINLQSLIMEGNRLENPDFPDSYISNKALTDVVMSNNPLAKLSNQTFKYLQGSNVRKLEVSRSQITVVESGSFAPLLNLMSLKIGYNPLDSKQLENVIHGLSKTSLVSLDIRNLSLAGELPSETFVLLSKTSIKYLKMANNKINAIPKGAFANLPKLILIDISACRIQTISEQAFENLTELQTLFLNDNNLVNIPGGFPKSLTKLYLNGNQIGAITNGELANLNILQELYLGKNKIHELQEESFIDLKKLKKLHLPFNQISTLPGKVFIFSTNLISLELDHNNIKVIPVSPGRFSSLTSLLYLNLNDNDLEALPSDILDPLQNLQYLHLQNNQLGSFIAKDLGGHLFANLGKLKELHLSNNQLHILPQPMLGNLKSLQILDLSRNKVSHWAKNFFYATQSLLTLDLSYNWISLFNKTSISNLRSLQSLNLSNNPFTCTCDAVWFCNWYNDTDIVLPEKNGFACNAPASWQSKSFRSFCNSHIDCTNYTLYYIIGACFAGILVSMIIVGLMYRYRWYVKYRAYKVRRAFYRLGHRKRDYCVLPGDDKVFDIYVSSAELDKEWVMVNIVQKLESGELLGMQNTGAYKVCFKERDFNPALSEIASIEENLLSSNHVLIVATDKYVKCAFCEFEFELIMSMMANKNMKSFQLIKVGVLPIKIPAMIEKLIERHDYIEWVNPQCAELAFFERLKDKFGCSLQDVNVDV